MKKYLGFLVIVGVLFAGYSSVQAEVSTGTSGSGAVKPGITNPEGMLREAKTLNTNLGTSIEKQEIKAELRTKTEALRDQAESKMAALKEKIKTEKNALLKKAKEERLKSREQAIARFDLAIERVTTFEGRVNVQIDKVAELGIDTTLAQTHVNTAHTKLEEAKTKVLEIHTMLATSTDEIKGDKKAKLKILITDTENLLRDSYKTLNEAVKVLKDGVKAKRASDTTSTNSTTTTNQ